MSSMPVPQSWGWYRQSPGALPSHPTACPTCSGALPVSGLNLSSLAPRGAPEGAVPENEAPLGKDRPGFSGGQSRLSICDLPSMPWSAAEFSSCCCRSLLASGGRAHTWHTGPCSVTLLPLPKLLLAPITHGCGPLGLEGPLPSQGEGGAGSAMGPCPASTASPPSASVNEGWVL